MFLAVETVNGTFKGNGVLGLAPTPTDTDDNQRSIINHMKTQGVVERAIVAINFEDPLDESQQSTVSFGDIDYS